MKTSWYNFTLYIYNIYYTHISNSNFMFGEFSKKIFRTIFFFGILMFKNQFIMNSKPSKYKLNAAVILKVTS